MPVLLERIGSKEKICAKYDAPRAAAALQF
jgi:hypothetical protein